jgi:hypothetical protein
MTFARLALLAIGFTLAGATAHASSVTVVVTGDAELQATLSKHTENWLRSHGHSIAASLSVEATTTLLNCMTMDDQGCARGVVEAQAKGESVLFAQALKSRSSNATVLNVYWFPKGKEPIGMRRACEECNADLMRSTVDEMLGMILGASKLERGRIALHSKPEGMTVLLDNENIGVTPLEREVPAGEHRIVLMHRGQKVGERSVKVHAEVAAEITVPVTLPSDDDGGDGEAPSRLVPGILLGVGGIAVATGVVLYLTSETDDGTKPTYRDTKPLGIGVAAGGVAVAAVGAWLWVRAGRSSDSAPVATIHSHGGIVGWSRAF